MVSKTANIRVSREFASILRQIERDFSTQQGFQVGLPKMTKRLAQPPMGRIFKIQLSNKRRTLFKL